MRKSFVILLLTYVMGAPEAISQTFKSYEINFINNGREISNVRYYCLLKDTAYSLNLTNGKLRIDSSLLKMPAIQVMAIFNRYSINFRIETDSFYFLKITSFRKGFKKYYTVYHGSEYEEIVKSTPAKDILRNKVVK